MRRLKRLRPSAATLLVALLSALVFAAGANALAGRNTVDSGDIKARAVNSSDIRDSSVRSRDIRTGHVLSSDLRNGTILPADLNPTTVAALRGQQGGAGSTGPQGPAGADGAAATGVVSGKFFFATTGTTSGTTLFSFEGFRVEAVCTDPADQVTIRFVSGKDDSEIRVAREVADTEINDSDFDTNETQTVDGDEFGIFVYTERDGTVITGTYDVDDVDAGDPLGGAEDCKVSGTFIDG
jgi:hypothetical protein